MTERSHRTGYYTIFCPSVQGVVCRFPRMLCCIRKTVLFLRCVGICLRSVFVFRPGHRRGTAPPAGGVKKYIGGENTMAKRICAFLTALLMVLSLAACGKTYTCGSCGKKTSQAYYDFWGSRNSLLCRNCAVAYWGDMFSEDLRVN